MVCHGSHQYTPVMLACIPYTDPMGKWKLDFHRLHKPYGSKHCLRRYLTLQIIVNYTPNTSWEGTWIHRESLRIRKPFERGELWWTLNWRCWTPKMLPLVTIAQQPHHCRYPLQHPWQWKKHGGLKIMELFLGGFCSHVWWHRRVEVWSRPKKDENHGLPLCNTWVWQAFSSHRIFFGGQKEQAWSQICPTRIAINRATIYRSTCNKFYIMGI